MNFGKPYIFKRIVRTHEPTAFPEWAGKIMSASQVKRAAKVKRIRKGSYFSDYSAEFKPNGTVELVLTFEPGKWSADLYERY